MRSPRHAMLWEIWRVTRVEAAWRLAIGVVGGLAALVLCAALAPPDDPKTFEATQAFGAVIAMILIVVPHSMGWLLLPSLNGGRPGFPLYLLYTRPIRTAAMVGLPMAYLAAVPSAIYLASALLLRVTSGHPFPLLPVAAWIGALNLIYLPIYWSTRSRVVWMLGLMVAGSAWLQFANHRLNSFPNDFDWHDSPKMWPTIFDFPLTDYALIALLGLASFGVAVAGVARQRHGDAPAAISRSGTGFPEWLVNLFPFPCPTSSATRAQVWFELTSRGLPVLTIGVVLAIATALLFAVSRPIDAALFGYVTCRTDGCFYARPFAVLVATLSVPAVLALGGNVFGVRWRQGGVYASAFEAGQPYGTARLAGLKVLVRSVCVLAALIAVGVSAWASGVIIAIGEIADVPLSSWQRAIDGAVFALTGYEQLALVAVASLSVALTVASLATLAALWARYPRRLNIAGLLCLLYGLALVLLALRQHSSGLEFPLGAILRATSWVAASAIVLATGYLLWRGFAEQLLTLRQASGAVLVSAAFGAAWLTMLRAAGLSLAGMPATDAAWMLSPALMPLTISLMAPWSLSRIRHL